MARCKVGSLYVQVLGSGSWDISPGLLLFCEAGQAYSVLFNCGEGTQRFCAEQRMRIATRLRGLLLTRLTWESIGGLPGMLFTLNDAGRGGNLQVCGPTGLSGLVRSFRHFMGASALPGVIAEVVDAETIHLKESGIIATPIVLGALAFDPMLERPTTSVAALGSDEATPSKRQRAECASGRPELLVSDGVPVCVCWLLQMPDIPPKFNARAAKELGVPNGPLRGKLCAGEAVALADGSLVTPEQVLTDGAPGEHLLVIDCASLAQVAQLRGHPLFATHAVDQTLRPLAAVIHLTPSSIAGRPEYAELCAAMPKQTMQMILGRLPQPQRFAFVASARLQLKLGSLHSVVFPPPLALGGSMSNEGRLTSITMGSEGAVAGLQEAPLPPGCVAADMLSRIVLRPLDKAGLAREDEVKLLRWTTSTGKDVSLHTSELKQEVAGLVELPRSLCALSSELLEPTGTWQAEVRATCETAEIPAAKEVKAPQDSGAGAGAGSDPTAVATIRGSRASITFLGTGAAMPAKYRNVSSFLLQLGTPDDSAVIAASSGNFASGEATPDGTHGGMRAKHAESYGGILFDCGEGTLAALRRRFGHRAEQVVASLSMVWISHMHADHHLGLLGVLELRRALALQPGYRGVLPLVVVGPRALGTWLREAASRLHTGVEFCFVHCVSVGSDASVGVALRRFGCRWMASAPVEHCPDAWSVALQHNEGWGLVYSGDTRPCETVVKLGQQLDATCRLLVHEATFDDTEDMAYEAVARRHSTVSEALRVGEQMGAWRVFLTHFSQRYPKLADVRHAPTSSALIAFDLMSVPFRLLPSLPELTSALLCLFEDELDSLCDEQSLHVAKNEPAPKNERVERTTAHLPHLVSSP